MAEYGVTTEGFVKKRYDSIYEEIQAAIKKGTGIDISVNQKSYINVLMSSVTDKIEELWEVLEATYYSMFPSSAEGVNLDYVCQLGGVLRKEGTASKFYIVCTGDDGTRIPTMTESSTSATSYVRIATSAKPTYYLMPCNDDYITLSNCNKVQVDVWERQYDTDYVITLNGAKYTTQIKSDGEPVKTALIERKIFGDDVDTEQVIDDIEAYKAGHLGMTYNVTTKEWDKDADYLTVYNAGLSNYYAYVETYDEQVDYEFKHELFEKFLDLIATNESRNYTANIVTTAEYGEVLEIASTSEYTNAPILLGSESESEKNLTSRSVSTVILFQTEDLGEYHFNRGVVDTIISGPEPLKSVYNLPVGIYGSLRETDEELRQSYVKKMALRSCSLTQSIQAAVLNNCEGVISCVCFENDLGIESDEHMPAHSIFVVVDGGSREAIAEQIYYYKPAGIYTWDGTWTDEATGETYNEEYAENVEVPTDYNSSIWINFARPQNLYVWLEITLFKDPYDPIPSNLLELVQEAIQEFSEGAELGEMVYLQRLVPIIDEKTTGIAYMNIKAATTDYETADDNGGQPAPTDFTLRAIDVTKAQKAAFDTVNRLIIYMDSGKGEEPEKIYPV